MKEKILAELVKKYPGLSKKFLGLWADKLTPKVTAEDEIEGIVNELDNLPVSLPDLAIEFQKEGDSRVSEAKKKWKGQASTTPTGSSKKKETTEDDDEDEPAPKWAQKLMTEVETLRDEKNKTSLQQKFQDKLKEKKIPATFAKKWSVESEDEIDSMVEEITKDYEDFQQDLVNQGLSTKAPSGGTPATSETGADADIKAWASRNQSHKDQRTAVNDKK